MSEFVKEQLEKEVQEIKQLAYIAVKNKQPKVARKHIKKIKELDKKIYEYNFEPIPYDLSKSEDD